MKGFTYLGQLRRATFAMLAVAAFLAPAPTSWAQPPAPPNEGGGATKPQLNIRGRRMRVQRGEDGKTVIETLDENGKVIERRQWGGGFGGFRAQPPAPPTLGQRPPKRGGGALAVAEKYVFVLLNGVLYQYDLETLELKAHARVEVPGGQAAGNPMGLFFGNAPRQNRAWLGIQLAPVDDATAKKLGLDKAKGALIAGVVEGGPAEKAGLKAGDVVLKFGNKDLEVVDDLVKAVGGLDPGETATVEVLRDGEKQTLKIKLAQFPRAAVPEAAPAEPAAALATERRTEMRVEKTNDEAPRVTLDLQNADLAEVLRMLAVQTKANIAFGKEVKGKVNATLHDMTVEQALDSLLAPRGFTWQKTKEGIYAVTRAGE